MAKKASTGHLELRHLRYFLAVVEEMNFSQAAERLNIAQPGLSQQIRVLERILGASLFDRSRRQIRLTPAAEALAQDAARVLADTDRAMDTARRASRGEIGRLAIGYVGSAAYAGALSRILREYRERYPGVDLDISELEMRLQLEALDAGRLDVGFIRPPVPLPPGVAAVSILREDLMIALPGTHPLAGRVSVALRDLSDETFITPHHPPMVSFRAHVMETCAEAGFEPRLGDEGSDFMTIVSMVSVGLGVALVPQSVRCISLPNCVYRPLEGVTRQADLSIAFRSRDSSCAVRNFVSLARGFPLDDAPSEGGAEPDRATVRES